jgi:hypothetical protein
LLGFWHGGTMPKKSNQERGRKYGGSSSFVDVKQPSRAPHQDEELRDVAGATAATPDRADDLGDQQGISNRPVSDEHAFPESDAPEEPEGSVDDEPKQQGGNRGRV